MTIIIIVVCAAPIVVCVVLWDIVGCVCCWFWGLWLLLGLSGFVYDATYPILFCAISSIDTR